MHNGTAENINPVKLEELNEEQLFAVTEEYPYYSVAQFHLLAKYKQIEHTNFEEQALKTALYFNNAGWLNKQLYSQPEHENNYETGIDISTATGNEVPGTAMNVPEENTEASTTYPLPAEDKNEVLNVFEPLHTVDYFASQGIKVSEEPISSDKLSTQLKSFTEWLKSMKKIHTGQLPGGDEQTDQMIQNLAEGSNTTTNVITEAMAEVLVKQNKIEQAIEMYEKLSLNYPAKSAYFAAKIESLKPV